MTTPKWWGKSKTVLFGSIQAIQGFLLFALTELHNQLNSNIEWIKTSGIDAKWIYLLMGVNGAIFIWLRFKSKGAVTTKQGVEDANTNTDQAVS